MYETPRNRQIATESTKHSNNTVQDSQLSSMVMPSSGDKPCSNKESENAPGVIAGNSAITVPVNEDRNMEDDICRMFDANDEIMLEDFDFDVDKVDSINDSNASRRESHLYSKDNDLVSTQSDPISCTMEESQATQNATSGLYQSPFLLYFQ